MQNTSSDFKDYQRSKMHEATKQFRETEEYELLKKKKAQAYDELQNRFNADDFEFIDQCIGVFVDAEYQKMEFTYSEAYRDCVSLLKELSVIN